MVAAGAARGLAAEAVEEAQNVAETLLRPRLCRPLLVLPHPQRVFKKQRLFKKVATRELHGTRVGRSWAGDRRTSGRPLGASCAGRLAACVVGERKE